MSWCPSPPVPYPVSLELPAGQPSSHTTRSVTLEKKTSSFAPKPAGILRLASDWPGLWHTLTSEPIIVAGGQQGPDWLALGHVLGPPNHLDWDEGMQRQSRGRRMGTDRQHSQCLLQF